MHGRRNFLLVVIGAGLLFSTAPAAVALAAPVTVDLRVEGSTQTLYEGPISTEGQMLETASSGGAHPCDYAHNGNSNTFENGGSPAATPTTALHDAARAAGLAFDAEWFGSGPEGKGDPGDFFVTRLGPDANQTSGSFDSWGYAVNYLTAPVGGCQIALAPGSEVLWAYNYFNLEHRLRLTGPASANLGSPFKVSVADGGTGEPLAGMTVGEMSGGTTTPQSGAVTNSAGEATVVLGHLGTLILKAQGPGAVRSNGLPVCVHNGSDGTCGSSLPSVSAPTVKAPVVPDVALVQGIPSGRVFTRRAAPRVLRGAVTVSAGGTLRGVRISLQRRAGKRCWVLSNTRGRFVRSRCNKASFFSVGGSLSFSYLLPSRLGPGRYVYDVQAIEASGKTTDPVNGVSHVVFRVR
jgi:hypothetical protein